MKLLLANMHIHCSYDIAQALIKTLLLISINKMDQYPINFENLQTTNSSLRPSQGFWGDSGTREFISGEQGNKGLKMRGTGQQWQFWGT